MLPELARLGLVEGANLAITAHVGAMGDLPAFTSGGSTLLVFSLGGQHAAH